MSPVATPAASSRDRAAANLAALEAAAAKQPAQPDPAPSAESDDDDRNQLPYIVVRMPAELKELVKAHAKEQGTNGPQLGLLYFASLFPEYTLPEELKTRKPRATKYATDEERKVAQQSAADIRNTQNKLFRKAFALQQSKPGSPEAAAAQAELAAFLAVHPIATRSK